MAKFIKQQSVLIIFTDAHLAYSPTTLNLFYTLKENYKVKLLSAKPSAAFSDNVIVDPDIAYIELKRDIRNVLRDIFYRVFDLFIKPSENTLSEGLSLFKLCLNSSIYSGTGISPERHNHG